MKITAVASSGPIRERALLIAEARPELRDGTDVISAVVSGATSSEMPLAKTSTAGSRSISTLGGGTRLDGLARVASHVALVAGIRASQSRPRAISAGPTVMKMRGPILA